MYILFRYRGLRLPHALISFGILWFFINLLIESSIIVLDNVIYEHRMYLPSIGVFSALSIAIFMAINRWRAYARAITAMLAVIIIALTGATYARNAVWKDELTLWQDVVNKSPNSATGYNNLCEAYNNKGLFKKAVEECQTAVNIDPKHFMAYNNLGNAYESLGFPDMAMKQYQNAINIAPGSPTIHYNIGKIYHLNGSIDSAIEHYLLAVKLRPIYPKAHHNLGVTIQV